MKQVEELTDGAISGTAMKLSLSVGVAVSVGLAMTRVLTGISILWYLIPGYGAALALSFFVPKIFTAIAFGSGGLASASSASYDTLRDRLLTVGLTLLSVGFGAALAVLLLRFLPARGKHRSGEDAEKRD